MGGVQGGTHLRGGREGGREGREEEGYDETGELIREVETRDEEGRREGRKGACSRGDISRNNIYTRPHTYLAKMKGHHGLGWWRQASCP